MMPLVVIGCEIGAYLSPVLTCVWAKKKRRLFSEARVRLTGRKSPGQQNDRTRSLKADDKEQN